jgi:hypothetical protein
VSAGCKGSWRVSFVAPVEAVFDLLEQGGATLRRQAEAMEGGRRFSAEKSRSAPPTVPTLVHRKHLLNRPNSDQDQPAPDRGPWTPLCSS